MSEHPILDLGLRNLTRHDLRHHGDKHNLFCDAFAQFGVAFPGLAPIGIGPVCPKRCSPALIENVLLDPAQFFGEIPFPSTAYDEPTYDSTGYWRGRAWPHITYWLLQTLVRHGYVAEANEAARRTLTALPAPRVSRKTSPPDHPTLMQPASPTTTGGAPPST